MKTNSYPYSKSVMLNAVYDALDNLGIGIEQANSEWGVILARFGNGQCRILLETVYPTKTSRLTLLPSNEECTVDPQWSDAFFDEVSATLKRSYSIQ